LEIFIKSLNRNQQMRSPDHKAKIFYENFCGNW
jgi:hypothetical protein